MALLRRVILKGFKSIREMDLELRPLNVLIGANGAGKSNLISFFKMLSEMMGERLQQYVSSAGRAHSLLYYGPHVTTHLRARLEFEDGNHLDSYDFTLFYASGDAIFFSDETLGSTRASKAGDSEGISLGAGHHESRIMARANRGERMALEIRGCLDRCRVYHFHDTSATARVRQYGYIGDNGPLMPDAGNLAAFLHRLQNQDRGSPYNRIVSTIRLIAPFFQDFSLVPSGPNGRDIILNWRDKESDQIFGPHQLSDGTLRVMSLVALLMQPESELPGLIIVDEPELGLHPYAMNVVASLLKVASRRTQVLITTQSSSFLDQFDPADVIVVDREGKESIFSRPDPVALEAWLDEYSLGEVWEKNVIGGGPH
ncbi:MAG: AAA family ATPase [Isosphaeraceae bacterium]